MRLRGESGILLMHLEDFAAGFALAPEMGRRRDVTFLVENNEGISAILEPALGQVKAVNLDDLRIAAEIVAIQPDAAARQSRRADA